MRIAVAVHGYPPSGQGGVERVAREQAEALVERGHEVFVFAREVPDAARPEGSTRQEETRAGVSLRRVAVAGGGRSPFGENYDGGFLDRPFRSFLREVRPEVIHFQHLVTMSNRMVEVARAEGIPVVLSLHDAYYLCHRLFLLDAQGLRCAGPEGGRRCIPCLEEYGAGDAPIRRFEAMQRLLEGVEAITAPSASLRRRYEAEWPALHGRIEIIEPGLVRRPNEVVRGDRRGRALRLLSIGTLMPHKGLDLVVEALEKLDRDSFTLTIHGEKVETGRAWLAALQERTRGKPVHWRPPFATEELDRVLAGADVLVLASRCDESWSRVVREARAAGLAVVAPSSGGPADWLRDGEDGLLFEPDSAVALARVLQRLAAEPQLLEALSFPAPDVPTVAAGVQSLERVLTGAIESRASRVGSALRARVTVAYLTKDGAPWLDESLNAVRAQQGSFTLVEILAVDSGSTDGTLEVLERHRVRTVQIPPHAFSHGATRNLAVRESRGDVVVFLTQDAAPADEDWLSSLLAGFARDPLAVAVWSRHVPRSDCHPMEWRILQEYPPFSQASSAVQAFAEGSVDRGSLDEQCSLSNNAAAYRREFLLEHPFPEVAFAEDRAWARQVLDSGWHTFLARDSIIRHSHAYSAWMNLRRNFDHARSLAMDFGHRDGFGLLAGWRASFREARSDLDFWAEKTGEGRFAVARRWGVAALLYHQGAFAGRWLGARSRRFPRSLARRLSLHEAPRSHGVAA